VARHPTLPNACVGWREWIALPDLGIRALKVKVDTGAQTSALHAFELERFRRRSRDMVRFVVHPEQRSSGSAVAVSCVMIDERRVRSSSGHGELRPVIATRAVLGALEWTIEVTLTSRDAMGFRMLLGRRALSDHFVVDPSSSYLAGAPLSSFEVSP
jgi:hypothetical protein